MTCDRGNAIKVEKNMGFEDVNEKWLDRKREFEPFISI